MRLREPAIHRRVRLLRTRGQRGRPRRRACPMNDLAQGACGRVNGAARAVTARFQVSKHRGALALEYRVGIRRQRGQCKLQHGPQNDPPTMRATNAHVQKDRVLDP